MSGPRNIGKTFFETSALFATSLLAIEYAGRGLNRITELFRTVPTQQPPKPLLEMCPPETRLVQYVEVLPPGSCPPPQPICKALPIWMQSKPPLASTNLPALIPPNPAPLCPLATGLVTYTNILPEASCPVPMPPPTSDLLATCQATILSVGGHVANTTTTTASALALKAPVCAATSGGWIPIAASVALGAYAISRICSHRKEKPRAEIVRKRQEVENKDTKPKTKEIGGPQGGIKKMKRRKR